MLRLHSAFLAIRKRLHCWLQAARLDTQRQQRGRTGIAKAESEVCGSTPLPHTFARGTIVNTLSGAQVGLAAA